MGLGGLSVGHRLLQFIVTRDLKIQNEDIVSVGHVTKNVLPRCVGFVNMSVEQKSKTKRQNFVLNQS